MPHLYVLIFALISSLCFVKCDISNEEELKNFLDNFDNELATINDQKTDIAWKKDAYYNEEEAEEGETPEEIKLSKELTKLKKFINEEKTKSKFNLNDIKDNKLNDLFTNLPNLGYEALNEDDMAELEATQANMSLIYRKVYICSFEDRQLCNLTLIPHVQEIIHNSNNTEEIEYYWNEWQTKSGFQAKDDFTRFIEFYRKTATANGYQKPSDYWFRKFGKGDEIIRIIDKLVVQIQPLFEQFHARIRGLLRQKYGSETIRYNWPFPQQLSEKYISAAFRNEDHDGIELPYHEAGLPNVTEALQKKELLPKSFFELAESFYQSIGLTPLESDFWDKNVLPKGDPSETYLYCTNKVYNYYGKNTSPKMTHCPNVDNLRLMNMFETVSTLHFHKESKIQPTLFQMEPFQDFYESLGKVFSLSATTPKYLEKIGILPSDAYNAERRLNRLYFLGFQEVFVLPVLYILDKYRIDVMNEKIKTWDNCAYWDLTEKYTGAIPPYQRSNKDFDIPSKLLIGVDEIYSGTIIGTAIKYQVYKHLCEKAGQYEKGNPNLQLNDCDLSDHPEIGENVSKAMSLGSSKSWKEILSILTDGETELSFDGLIEYFEPLIEWLKKDNEQNNAEVGWQETNQCKA
ncbi:angiotensin-converting enzyme [Condylostylus longicornis]|uniref:angiotensin-converting enzyme n=1 Tax=Condylostylus longicornis TaxID=2530218 RepID=UPI00244E125C|nr:angiotensin-converting enzyme [Condylostylus longicornis]